MCLIYLINKLKLMVVIIFERMILIHVFKYKNKYLLQKNKINRS